MDSSKPLTAGEIEELKEEIRTMPHKEFFGENLQPLVDDHSRLLSLLTPPPDAAVREAVERLDNSEYTISLDGSQDDTKQMWEDIDTLIAHARAVHAPRLTPEQVEAVKNVNRKTESRQCICGDGYLCARCEILGELSEAFPEAFGDQNG